jgi:hypothetical protein
VSGEGARKGGRTSLLVLGLYVVLAVVLLGTRVLLHPGRDYVGGLTTDPQVFIWSLKWWPHALLHGLNPFVTKEIWAPVGVNLAWAQTAPALALAFAPLTALAGPVVAYNVAALLMPALAAWTAFLLCRRLTREATWPSFVGGCLFGFSTYVIAGTLAHVQTTAVFVIPLVALVVLQFLDGELRAGALALRLGLLLTLQAFLETEILFTLTLALVVGLVLAAILAPRRRPCLVSLIAPLAGAYLLTGILMSPLLYYLAVGESTGSLPGSDAFVGDALNFVVPTHIEAIGWWAANLGHRLPANDAERGTYIGLPALVIVALFARSRWRTQGGRFLLVALLLSAVATLGSWLTFDGRRLTVLPWVHLAWRPLFRDLMPVRFSLYTALAIAVIVAMWSAATASSWLRIGLPVLALLALAPNIGLAEWAGPGTRALFAVAPPTIPRLFTGNGYQTCLRKNEVVLALPFGARGNELIWQAKSNFWFRLAGGYLVNTVPPAFQTAALLPLAGNDRPDRITLEDVRAFAHAAGVTTVVLNGAQAGPWRKVLDQLGPPHAVDGVLIYSLDRAHPPLCRATS